MRLKLELFVDDLDRSVAFYQEVLGFEVAVRKPDGYTEMLSGGAAIALNRRAVLGPDHPIHASEGERRGLGVEVALLVPDIRAAYDRVLATGWPISTALTPQPWGRTDFRLLDPDGIYVRVSDEAA